MDDTAFASPDSTADLPLISVIIPNWNGAHHLPTCLDALRRQTYPHFEVIVVDNASTDGSVKLVERDYPEVGVRVLAANRGLTGAVNEGIAVARGEIIALLNNDTEADPDWLSALHRALKTHPEAGSAASKMLLFDQRDTIHSAGDLYRVDGVPGNRGVWQRDEGQFNQVEEVFAGCGGAVAYRRAMLEDIGLMDEDLFMYCEDVDLGWRAQLAGYRCVYAPDARVYHRLSATGGGRIASFYTGRNWIYVLVKDYPASLLRKHWWRILLAQLRVTWEALRAWRGEAARARLRGQIAGVLFAPRLLRKRWAVQRSRRVSDAYLESILES